MLQGVGVRDTSPVLLRVPKIQHNAVRDKPVTYHCSHQAVWQGTHTGDVLSCVGSREHGQTLGLVKERRGLVGMAYSRPQVVWDR